MTREEPDTDDLLGVGEEQDVVDTYILLGPRFADPGPWRVLRVHDGEERSFGWVH